MPVASSSQGALVLVVEDDRPLVELIQELLAAEGCRVITARDGATALARLGAADIDLVLLDLMLPDVHGLELCHQFRARASGGYVPIILLTARSTPEDRHAGFAAGADDYVTKPFDVADLLDRLAVWLRARERLKQQQAALLRQAALLDLASDGIFVRDLAGRITYWNAGAAALYGWTRAEAQGKVSHTLLCTEFPQPRAEIEATVIRTGAWEGEVVHTRRDGTRLRVASRWALQPDDTGGPLAILELNTDVTERRRLEAEGAARARLEGVLLAARTMEHELGNKLTPTRGYTALLARDPALPTHLHHAAEQACSGAADALRLLRRLMQLTALQEQHWSADLGTTIKLDGAPH